VPSIGEDGGGGADKSMYVPVHTRTWVKNAQFYLSTGKCRSVGICIELPKHQTAAVSTPSSSCRPLDSSMEREALSLEGLSLGM
jgi:hypothetical protein